MARTKICERENDPIREALKNLLLYEQLSEQGSVCFT